MPFKNHILEADLKAYIPELSRLLWSDETDYSAQKTAAVEFVSQDLLDRGFKGYSVMPELVLRDAGTVISADENSDASLEDVISRRRLVYTVTDWVTGGAKSIILKGSNDKTTWVTVKTISVTANVSSSAIIDTQYKYYKVSATLTGGSMDFRASMVETTFDRLIIFKWLELILLDRYVEEDDQFHSKMMYFQKSYNSLWNTITIWRDADDNGNIESGEKATANSIPMYK